MHSLSARRTYRSTTQQPVRSESEPLVISFLIGYLTTTVFLRCFLHPRCAPPGSSRVADAAELSVSEAADSSGGVHLLSDTLWWKRPLFDLSGPHQLHREERDPLLPAEEPDQAERRRSAVTAGTWDLAPVSNRFFIGWFRYLENKVAYTLCNADKLYITQFNDKQKCWN